MEKVHIEYPVSLYFYPQKSRIPIIPDGVSVLGDTGVLAF